MDLGKSYSVKRSAAGYVLKLFVFLISCCFPKKIAVALLPCDLEYVLACNAICQGVLLPFLLGEMKAHKEEEVEHMVDKKNK